MRCGVKFVVQSFFLVKEFLSINRIKNISHIGHLFSETKLAVFESFSFL